MAINIIHSAMLENNVDTVVAMPDSILSKLCQKILDEKQIDYIQVNHESDGVGICTGITMTGKRSLMIMENSGLRSACESIARLNLSHNLFACYLISYRGAFGERNWWGQAHHETMFPLLDLLRIRWKIIDDIQKFPEELKNAFSTLDANQSSVALVVHPTILT